MSKSLLEGEKSVSKGIQWACLPVADGVGLAVIKVLVLETPGKD